LEEIGSEQQKVLGMVNPKTRTEDYAVGKTIWRYAKELTNQDRKEPFRY